MATESNPGMRPGRRLRIVGERRYPTDGLPPPLTGWVGGLEVHLHLWPPDCDPHRPEAVRASGGALAGYWCVWRVP